MGGEDFCDRDPWRELLYDAGGHIRQHLDHRINGVLDVGRISPSMTRAFLRTDFVEQWGVDRYTQCLRVGIDPDVRQGVRAVSRQPLDAWEGPKERRQFADLFVSHQPFGEDRKNMAIRIWLCLKVHSRPDSSSSISVFMSAP